MTKKVLSIGGGALSEVLISPTGSDGDLVCLASNGKLDPGVVPDLTSGGGSPTNKINCKVNSSGTLAGGDFVNIYDDGGNLTARFCDGNAGTPRECHGYIAVAGTHAAGSTVAVTLKGAIQSSPATPTVIGGSAMYIAGNAGKVSVTKPTTTGYMLQKVGVSERTSPFNFFFDPEAAVILL